MSAKKALAQAGAFSILGAPLNADDVAKIVDAAIRAHDAAHAGPWGIGWEAWAIVGATIIGPVAAIVVSLLMTWRHDATREMRERRLRVFRTLLATRATAAHYEHVSALNLVEIDFYGIAPVIEAWRAYMKHLSSLPGDRPLTPEEEKVFGDRRTDLLATLLRRIAEYMGYNAMGEIDLKRGGYAPSLWSIQVAREAEMQLAVARMMRGEVALRVRADPPK